MPSPAPHTVSTQHNEWMKGEVNKPQGQVWGAHVDTQAQGNDLPTLLWAQRLRNPTHTVSRYSSEMEKSSPPGILAQIHTPNTQRRSQATQEASSPAFQPDPGVYQVMVKPGCS